MRYLKLGIGILLALFVLGGIVNVISPEKPMGATERTIQIVILIVMAFFSYKLIKSSKSAKYTEKDHATKPASEEETKPASQDFLQRNVLF